MPRVVIAGLRGGSGKTTLSVGITAALLRRGVTVAPFKKGPDYIDAGWLARAAGRACYNLDPFLIGEESILSSFAANARGAGIALVEGNRGLFDGMDAEGSMSTARVARTLRAPIVLIVDCAKRTRTTAAVLAGVAGFERGVEVRGVVLNMIAGARHEQVTREAIERYTDIEVLGALPRARDVRLPERHLGLTPTVEHPEVEEAIEAMAAFIERNVDMDRVVSIARGAPALMARTESVKRAVFSEGPLIGVVRDSAFQFYYQENIESLEARGAQVLEVSALRAHALPPVDALYIGGGFPETHALQLSKNKAFISSLLAGVEAGLPVYAECGGLMFLGDWLEIGGIRHEMCGILPVGFVMHKRPMGHGYTVVKVTRANPFYKRGTVLRGHEFHYSQAVPTVAAVPARSTVEGRKAEYAFSMERGEGIVGGRDGIRYKNLLATYTHVHALGAPEWAEGMLRAARAYRKGRSLS